VSALEHGQHLTDTHHQRLPERSEVCARGIAPAVCLGFAEIITFDAEGLDDSGYQARDGGVRCDLQVVGAPGGGGVGDPAGVVDIAAGFAGVAAEPGQRAVCREFAVHVLR